MADGSFIGLLSGGRTEIAGADQQTCNPDPLLHPLRQAHATW